MVFTGEGQSVTAGPLSDQGHDAAAVRRHNSIFVRAAVGAEGSATNWVKGKNPGRPRNAAGSGSKWRGQHSGAAGRGVLLATAADIRRRRRTAVASEIATIGMRMALTSLGAVMQDPLGIRSVTARQRSGATSGQQRFSCSRRILSARRCALQASQTELRRAGIPRRTPPCAVSSGSCGSCRGASVPSKLSPPSHRGFARSHVDPRAYMQPSSAKSRAAGVCGGRWCDQGGTNRRGTQHCAGGISHGHFAERSL